MNDKCTPLKIFLMNPTEGIDSLLADITLLVKNPYADISKLGIAIGVSYSMFSGIIKKIFPLFNTKFIYELFIEKVFVTPAAMDAAWQYMQQFKDLPKNEIPEKFANYPVLKNAFAQLRKFQKDFKKELLLYRLNVILLKIGYFVVLFTFGLGAALFIEWVLDLIKLQEFFEGSFSKIAVWYIKISIGFVLAKYGADLVEEKIKEHFVKHKLITRLNKLQDLSTRFNSTFDSTWRNIGLNRNKVADFYYEYCVKVNA